MKKKLLKKETIPQRIERYSRSKIFLISVVFCLLFALTKMDGAVLRTMKASYAYGAALIDEYAREEPTPTLTTLGAEIRLTTVSGA